MLLKIRGRGSLYGPYGAFDRMDDRMKIPAER